MIYLYRKAVTPLACVYAHNKYTVPIINKRMVMVRIIFVMQSVTAASFDCCAP